MSASLVARRRGTSFPTGVRAMTSGPRSTVVFLLAVLALAAGVLPCVAWSAPATTQTPVAGSSPTPAPADTTILQHRIIAYYFHTDYRCPSCLKIEAYSHEAIEKGYPKELQDGRLVWRMVNTDEKGNEHFLEDYQLFTKSLVLVEETDGKQVRWKNLAKVWELLQNKKRFFSYVQAEVRGYLTEKP